MNVDRLLHTPSPRLRSLRGQRGLFLYMRYSAHVMTLIVLALMGGFALRLYGYEGNSPWASPWWYAAATLMVAPAATASWVVETAPDLNLQPRPTFHRALVCAVAVGAVCLGLALGLMVPATGLGERYGFFAAAMVSLWMLAWAVAPFLRFRWLLIAAIVAVTYLLARWARFDEVGWITVMPLLLFGTMVLTMWMLGVFKELMRVKETEAALSASEERLRIAQQLHDSLGQSLAAMSLKVQVIDKVMRKQGVADASPMLVGEVAALRGLVADTSTHMREVVHGYRQVSLDEELQRARSLLRDSGIAVSIRGGASELSWLSAERRQVASWFVREAATNVLQHARASTATITVSPFVVSVDNDGASGEPGKLSGLEHLNQRAQRVGGSIAASQHGGEFCSTLTFDTEGPQ